MWFGARALGGWEGGCEEGSGVAWWAGWEEGGVGDECSTRSVGSGGKVSMGGAGSQHGGERRKRRVGPREGRADGG